ncbi:MAG: hypothetical protein NT098_00410 [Candidatus Parcubacteria bacterium]|nr:hypothetical protein [Candidatus Parcubacteria bacterium]
MDSKLIIGVVIGIALGGFGGFTIGQSSGSGASSEKIAETEKMMKTAETSMQEMGKQMLSNGAMMQELGIKYSDETLVSSGKDLVIMGQKSQKETEKSNKMMME